MPEQQHTETTTTTETVHEERKSSLFTDILTIIGFAILFIIIIWGLVHLVELISGSFASSKPVATIKVTAPAETTTGQPVTISWSYSPAVSGTYAFLYQCQNGLTFQGSSAKDSGIPCGVAYTVGNASTSPDGKAGSISVIPMLVGTSSISDTLSIVFIPSQGGSQVQGDATMKISPFQKQVSKPVATAKPQKSGSSYSYTGTHNAGPADLSVQIISSNVDPSGAGTVTFDIGNIGGSTSGSYTFSAQLPTSPSIPYVSPQQAPLAPGGHIVNTLRFTDVAPGGGLFSVSILDGNDANAADDYASTQIAAPYNAYNNYNGYNPNTGYNNAYSYPQPYTQPTQYPNYSY